MIFFFLLVQLLRLKIRNSNLAVFWTTQHKYMLYKYIEKYLRNILMYNLCPPYIIMNPRLSGTQHTWTKLSTKNAYIYIYIYMTEMQRDEEETHRNYTYVTPVHDQTNDSPIFMQVSTYKIWFFSIFYSYLMTGEWKRAQFVGCEVTNMRFFFHYTTIPNLN